MIDLPDFSPLKITQTAEKPGSKQLDTLDHLIVLLPEQGDSAALRGLPKAAFLQSLFARASKAGETLVTTYLDNRRQTAVTVARPSPDSAFRALVLARKLIAEATRLKARRLGIYAPGPVRSGPRGMHGALLRAAAAAAFQLVSFASRKSRQYPGPRSLKLFGMQERLALSEATASCRGNNIARWLTALPPNKLTVSTYRSLTESLAAEYGLGFRFIGTDELRQRGAGAFLAVAQGNAHADAGIIHLSYRPGTTDRPELALVGKGILFDTGGINLKPFKSMLEMHTDMQGSAVALGTAIELAASQVPYAFDVWLAVTENQISPTAYKSQDVVVAANGTSIQVIHTDAEGRMVLADTLVLAGDSKPDLIIDFATLTGACVAALTTRYSGVFSNRKAAVRDLLAASDASGERVWPFPLDEDFDDPLKSDTADVKQCAVEGAGDHIFATRFLQRFVPASSAWVHMDLSAGQNKGGLGAIATDVTGFGVAYTLALLQDQTPSALASRWQEH